MSKFMIVLKKENGDLQVSCNCETIEDAIRELELQWLEEWANHRAFIVENIPVHLAIA